VLSQEFLLRHTEQLRRPGHLPQRAGVAGGGGAVERLTGVQPLSTVVESRNLASP
jgi:hypothetical protein